MQLSVEVRNARQDATETAIGPSPRLQLRTGAMPANCAAPRTGTLLADLAQSADWMGAASNGAKAISAPWTGSAIAAGTVGYYSVMNSAGTVCHMQGSVSDTNGTGELKLGKVQLEVLDGVGSPLNIPSWITTDDNA